MSKETTREKVKEKYVLVKHHDRVGRMADTLEYSDVAFPRARFTPELVAELQAVAPSLIEEDGDMIIVKHLYIERRMTPLNLYLETATPAQRERAIRDYGDALKQLTAVNIFAGDLLFKNFGVTRFGRVVFYDYDEIEYLTACNFRRIPPPPPGYDEMANEVWYPVGGNDVFPEEFETFLLTDPGVRAAFHGDARRPAGRRVVASRAAQTRQRRSTRSAVLPRIRCASPAQRRCPAPTASRHKRRPQSARTITSSAVASVAVRGKSPGHVFRLHCGADVTLSRGQHVPVECLAQVLRDTVAMLVETADDVLGTGVAVLGRGFVPSRGELPVLRRTAPEEILRRELHLGVGVVLFGGLLPPRVAVVSERGTPTPLS